jgi:hypothetical protein
MILAFIGHTVRIIGRSAQGAGRVNQQVVTYQRFRGDGPAESVRLCNHQD